MTTGRSARVLAAAGLAGACSMTLELSAVRLIAPWFGTSSVVWTHVIGVVLLALSVGYLLGGRFSRGARPERAFGFALLLAAAAVAWLPALAHPVASWFHPAGIALDEAATLLRWGSLASALLLFLPPTILLGCVPPLATEILQRDSERSAGDAGGRVLAISTLGSIAGTFATTYLVLPELGLTRTYLAVGAILALVGAVILAASAGGTRSTAMLLGIPVLGAMVGSRLREPDGLEGWRTLETAESAYQAIRVVESVGDGPRMRRMQVNEGFDSFQSVWQPEPGLLPDGYYYNLFALPMRWAPRQETWSVFVAGLGAGTAWRVLEGVAPEGMRMRLAGAEIDPKIVSLGERWFDLPGSDDTHLVLAGWDARAAMRGLAAEERLFDEIIVDAYANQMEIPAHLCSVEFFREARSRLAPRGWLAVNVGGFGLDDPVVRGVGKTIASAFERRVLGVRVPFSRNCVIFARRDAEPPEPGSPAWIPEGEPQAARLAALAIEGACRWFEPDGAAELTDDRNPIDTLQWESVRRGKQAWADGP